MFKELVPEYVIPQMLEKKVIADPRNTVTVLFVLINNFGEYTRTNRTCQCVVLIVKVVLEPEGGLYDTGQRAAAGRSRIQRVR